MFTSETDFLMPYMIFLEVQEYLPTHLTEVSRKAGLSKAQDYFLSCQITPHLKVRRRPWK